MMQRNSGMSRHQVHEALVQRLVGCPVRIDLFSKELSKALNLLGSEIAAVEKRGPTRWKVASARSQQGIVIEAFLPECELLRKIRTQELFPGER